MKIKTSELTGAALNWAVASIEYPNDTMIKERRDLDLVDHSYPFIEDWSQGGPIIEREKITIWFLDQDSYNKPYQYPWHAGIYIGIDEIDVCIEATHEQLGATPLIAAMRCFAASRLGNEVDIPEELLA